jgi:hypothetical protein
LPTGPSDYLPAILHFYGGVYFIIGIPGADAHPCALRNVAAAISLTAVKAAVFRVV